MRVRLHLPLEDEAGTLFFRSFTVDARLRPGDVIVGDRQPFAEWAPERGRECCGDGDYTISIEPAAQASPPDQVFRRCEVCGITEEHRFQMTGEAVAFVRDDLCSVCQRELLEEAPR